MYNKYRLQIKTMAQPSRNSDSKQQNSLPNYVVALRWQIYLEVDNFSNNRNVNGSLVSVVRAISRPNVILRMNSNLSCVRITAPKFQFISSSCVEKYDTQYVTLCIPRWIICSDFLVYCALGLRLREQTGRVIFESLFWDKGLVFDNCYVLELLFKNSLGVI